MITFRRAVLIFFSVIIWFSFLSAQGRIVEERDNELDPSIDPTQLKQEIDVYAVIRQVLSYRIGGLQYIYNKYKNKDKKFAGQVMIKMVIDGKGEVISARVVRSQLKSKVFHDEILGKIKTWKFGELPITTQEVMVPFYFK